MNSIFGIGLLVLIFLFGMDMAFNLIPRCIIDGQQVDGRRCMEQTIGYQTLSFYDPSVAEPERWRPEHLLIQISHPTIRKVPKTWLAWQIGWSEELIDVWAYHNQYPSPGLSALPRLDPPIKLANGDFAYDIRMLDQVQTK